MLRKAAWRLVQQGVRVPLVSRFHAGPDLNVASSVRRGCPGTKFWKEPAPLLDGASWGCPATSQRCNMVRSHAQHLEALLAEQRLIAAQKPNLQLCWKFLEDEIARVKAAEKVQPTRSYTREDAVGPCEAYADADEEGDARAARDARGASRRQERARDLRYEEARADPGAAQGEAVARAARLECRQARRRRREQGPARLSEGGRPPRRSRGRPLTGWRRRRLKQKNTKNRKFSRRRRGCDGRRRSSRPSGDSECRRREDPERV